MAAPMRASSSASCETLLSAASTALQCCSTCALNAASVRSMSAMIPGLAPTPKVHSCTDELNDATVVQTGQQAAPGARRHIVRLGGARTAVTGEGEGPGARRCTIHQPPRVCWEGLGWVALTGDLFFLFVITLSHGYKARIIKTSNGSALSYIP